MKKKLNITIGRFQPMTQGHLNMINEGDAPCIVYRINSSNKEILRTKRGIKIGSKSYTNDSVNNVIKFIDTPEGDLTEQEKELLKRPFTNELIDKELDIVKKSNKNIIDVVPVVNVYDALGKYNKFITENSDEYEVGDWMCGDDRKESYDKNIEGLGKYEDLEYEFRSGKTLPNILIGKLKVNTGKGRTEGVSGTAVRKSILNKDKAGFEKIMPKGTGIMFDDFIDAFNKFKEQLQNIIKEHKMMSLKKYILESEINPINEKLSFGDKINYLNESFYDSSDLEYLKKKLLKMYAGDRVHAVWGVREKGTDATRKDRMVDDAISIDKEKGDKYVICGSILFPAHELFWDALKESGVEKWYHFKGWAVRLGYEDMIKVLEVMPKFFDKYFTKNDKGIWHYLSFDKKECEEECKRQIRPLTITSLEDEIKGIEQGIKDLEAKKAQLQELKKAQAEEDMFKQANNEK